VSGPGYGGHVFWDADVFVLPFLAATCPSAARAMLEYRIRRLGPARQAAADRHRDGVRFPWESARSGTDVTPRTVRSATGALVPILTGEQEEHIVADIAWAALHYAAWTGDTRLLTGDGRPLVLDSARYWASRVRVDNGRAHIDGVIGPDEYHESVNDNAFTNVMARWNLRRAAELADAAGEGASHEEIARWRSIADALVDGYDPDNGLYEQFAGYHALEPLIISQFAETPVAADLLLGPDRVRSSQIIKQPDVLMLYHLVPEEMMAGSLGTNVDFYEPRCAHGSSLSPAIHASVLARAGRPDDALRLFRIACQLDLDDLTGTTSGGLHTANSGAVWQALAFGFAGIRPRPGSLQIAPQIPSTWQSLSLRMRYHDTRVEIRAGHEDIEVRSEPPLRVEVPGSGTQEASPSGIRWRRFGDSWEVIR
jgi:trehalose/maltose hydrolase-like predicted phosphorylase